MATFPTEPIIYWKPEAKERKWLPIPDTPTARETAIKSGAMFFTWNSFSEPISGNGQPEPRRWGDFPLDFDSKDIGQAWEEMATLCTIQLPETYDIDPYAIDYYLSGGKGFHAVIPAELFDATRGDPYLPLIYEKIAQQFKEQFGLSTLDISLYCMKRGKMFRIANVKRSNGFYKVPISLEELQRLTPEQLAALGKAPRQIDPVEVDLTPNPVLTRIFQTFQGQVYKEIKAQEEKPTTIPTVLSKDLPACVRYILKAMPKTSKTTFNKITIDLVSYFQAAGYSREEAISQANEFLTGYPHSTQYTTPEARIKHFSDLWKYVGSNGKYQFNCSYILGKGFPGSSFDCGRCTVNSQKKPKDYQLNPPEVEGDCEVIPTKTAKDEPLAFPADVMSGVAGQFARTYGQHLEPPEHFFYMTFLTCLGSVLADRLTLKTEIQPQPRFFTIILGESADDRKSTVIKKTVEFFKRAIDSFPTCWGVGSAEGLQKRFESESRVLLCLDEFKAFVGKCKIEASVLLPCVNTLFESNNYESWTKKSQICLQDAHLSILAASTVQTYERTWDSSFTDIGFNNRLFLVPGSGEKKHSFPSKVPDHKIELLKTDTGKVLQHAGYHPELDLTLDAKAEYHAWYMNLERSIHAKRLDTYALRLMALLAVNELKTDVDIDIVNKVLAICNWQYEVRQTHDPIDADNATAEMEEKIRRQLNKRPLSERELKQKTNANRAGLWFYNQAKNNLIHAKEIRWDKGLKKYAISEL